MVREDWLYINFDKALMESVDEAVKSVFSHGSPKYSDRKQFAQTAIQQLLDKELKTEVAAK